MDLNDIALFMSAVRLGSFKRVAQERKIAASSVSRTISGLESDLGIRLFERNARSFSITEEGSRFFENIEPLVEQFNKVMESTSGEQMLAGKLRVTAPASFGALDFMSIILGYQEKFPNVSLDLLLTDKTVDIVTENIDIAVRFGHLADSSFICTKLFPLNYKLCASPKYLKQEGAPKKPERLLSHNCLSFLVPEFGQVWKFKKPKRPEVIEVKAQGSLKISNALALKEASLRGFGIALLPEYLIKEELKSKKLIELFSNYRVSASQFDPCAWLVYPSRNYLPERTKKLVEFIKNHYR